MNQIQNHFGNFSFQKSVKTKTLFGKNYLIRKVIGSRKNYFYISTWPVINNEEISGEISRNSQINLIKNRKGFEHGTGDRVIDERLKLKLPHFNVAKP